MLRHHITTAVLLGTLAAPAAAPAAAQSLAQRVSAVRDGTVRLTFAVRPNVCGNGNNIRTNANGTRTFNDDGWRRSRDVEWDDDCQSGPGRLAIDVRGGEVQDLRFYVGGRWRPAGEGVTDIGQAPAKEVASFLLGTAERGPAHAAKQAIFPSTVVDSVTVWPDLLRLARDERVERETRSQAIFWLSAAAGDAATKGLSDLADDPEREIRSQAVFALSRRPSDEGVPALIRIARSHRDPQTRRDALFWLGRSKDPRALALFEELLSGK